MSCVFKVLFLLKVILLICHPAYTLDIESYDILMPNVRPTHDEQYLCTPIRIDPDSTYNIVGFVPNATMSVAHHMLLYGCTSPGSYEEVWNCGEMSANDLSNKIQSAPVCGSGSQIIYAWARDAPVLKLPEDVGFLVGKGSGIEYLVLQIHYMHKFPEGKTDNSGLFLEYTREPLKRQAGIFLLGTTGSIPPHSVTHMESACEITEDIVMHPFAYRTHTHTLGKVVAGYIVRQNPAYDDWLLLGKRNPMTPQMFYPTFTNEPIRMGDVVAARCTMKSDRDRYTYIGSTNEDEMCNFYLMYWVEGTPILNQKYCYTDGPPKYQWIYQGLKNIPEDASTL